MATGIRGGGATEPVAPLDKPHPTLANIGFHGPVSEFNTRVDSVVQSYQQAHGTPPPAGLALDVVKSPVPTLDLPKLFKPEYGSPQQARLAGAVAQHQAQNPHEYMVRRPDGIEQPNGIFASKLAAVDWTPDQAAKVAKTHPWVPYIAAALPIPNSSRFENAIAALDGRQISEQSGQITVGGKTLNQYIQARGVAKGNPTIGATLGLDAATATGPYKSQASAIQDFSSAQDHVQTVKQGQQYLLDNYPSYFAGLKPSGHWDNDWASAQAKFVGSAQYADAWTKKLAQDNYFGKDTGEFTKAWQRKQDMIRRGPVDLRNVFIHTPLAFFGDGDSVKRFLTQDSGNDHWYSFATHYTIGAVEGLGKAAFSEMTGLGSQFKAEAAAGTALFYNGWKNIFEGKGIGVQEAQQKADEALKQNPSWMRILYPPLPSHPKGGFAAADFASNLALDILLGRFAVGREIRPGAIREFNKSRYVNSAVEMAYNSAKNRGLDGVGEMSKVLQGGDQLHVAVAAAIKNGDITLGQYKQMVADLYHHGQVALEDGTAIRATDNPNNVLFRSLWSAKTPDPRLWASKLGQHLNELDANLRNSATSATTHVADAMSSIRGWFAHVAPHAGEGVRIEDTKTPERLYNWAIQQFNDRSYAAKLRNDFIVARAKNDFGAIEDLNKSMIERYAAEYPNRKGVRTPLESEGPLTESQSLSYLKVPAKRTKDPSNPFDKIAAKAQKYNDNLLTVGRYHRQMIISGSIGPVPFPGGESLFWKHAVADTLRRFAGGAGLRFGLNKTQKLAQADVLAFLKDNPGLARDLSVKRAAAKMGEFRWLTHDGPLTSEANFLTNEYLNDPHRMEAAGAYLRQLVTDDALKAYRLSSTDDKTALFRHVWHSAFYQNKIAKDEAFIEDLKTLKAFKGDTAAVSDLKKSYAQSYAEELWKTYKQIDVNGALDRAQQTFLNNMGAGADKALAQFIRDEKLAFTVKDPIVATNSNFDAWSKWWIGKLLTFNKLNRQAFFDHAFYDSYQELVRGGWEKADAITAASDLAKFQTVYHMLDFSNMLQVEQNLRWLSYYATKHRLYWSWIGRQMATRPGMALAVNDVAHTLDSNGNLKFEIGGVTFTVPGARLVWANNAAYPETSPLVSFGSDFFANLQKGPGAALAAAMSDQVATSGEVLGRQDQWVTLGIRLAAGVKTYGAITQGMSPVQLSSFNRIMHAWILQYHQQHGAWPDEKQAVTGSAHWALGAEMYRANLFLPFYIDKYPVGEPAKPTWFEQMSKQFDRLKDPRQRRVFLDKNPDFANMLGSGGDQGVWLHEAPLWDAFRTAQTHYLADMETLYQEMRQNGASVALRKEYQAAQQRYSAAIQAIKERDTQTWQGNATYPKGVGPWTQKLSQDPLAQRPWLHAMFHNIPLGELAKNTVGETVVELRKEADQIREWQRANTLAAHAYTPQKAKERLSAIFEKIAVFNGAPKNATSKAWNDYYDKAVSPYIKQRDGVWAKRVAAAKGTPDENTVHAEFRAWKELHDRPVKIDGITFPSPVSWGTMQLPPDQYKAMLATAASSDPMHVTSYEWRLLGVKAPQDVNSAVATLEKLKELYASDPQYAGTSLAKEQIVRAIKAIDKGYPDPLPGFPNGIKPHPGFYSWYVNYASLPKIDRFERTNLYANMDTGVKQQFDQLIGSYAKQGAKLIADKNSGYPSNYVKAKWRDYVKSVVMPDLQKPEYRQLAEALREYPNDFLYSLLATSQSG